MSRRRAGQGALFIVAMLFASSGALRLGSGIGAALAKAEGEGAAEAPPDATCEMPSALSEALTLREERIAVQEASLKDRLAALALADAAITRRMEEMKAVEGELKATLAQTDGAAEKDIQNLTAVYQAMKPKDAAALFETMSPEFAAGFLGRMPPDSAAAILSGMSAEAAYGVSVIVAGRNADVPKD
ncbi:MotE family protein [Tabrizicola sp.]|jgi:flagellar motility protein MotE (MotC chaperone)|uniref:MotE family protein n=1 Tax=Tabrizicola sp. TaxID=2005166 RepID=UPI0035B4EE76